MGSIYFSICMTTNDNGVDSSAGCTINNYIYAPQSDELRKVDASVPYESQYPLAAYSMRDNAIYFSKRIENTDGSHGDQLAVYRIDTKETEVLTDNIFAINEIIPLHDRVVLSACPFGSDGEQLMYYDIQTGELSSSRLLPDLKEGDSCVSFLSYNPLSGQLMAPAFSIMERWEKGNDFNSRKTRKVVPPVTTLYKASVSGKQRPTFEEMFLFDDEDIQFCAGGMSEDGTILAVLRNTETLLEGSDAEFEEQVQTWYLLDPKHPEEKREVPRDEQFNTVTTNLCYLAESNEVYFVGAGQDGIDLPQGFYRYKLDTKKLDLLFEVSDDGYINNFCALDGYAPD
jgi:hypothetical protein